MQSRRQIKRLAHIAGIIDAKGCFNLVRAPRASGNGFGYSIKLSVNSVRKRLPEHLYSKVGYGNLHSCFATHIQKDIFLWELYGKELVEFIKEIRPFLHLKGEQADVLVECQKAMELPGEERWKIQARLFNKCRKLKRAY